MSARLPRLRGDLDVVVSPVPDRPGLLLRDPFRYSESVIILPPVLARCLRLFDGSHQEAELVGLLETVASPADAATAAAALARGLSDAGFVDDAAFVVLRGERRDGFTRAPVREAAHSGGGYPAEVEPLAQALKAWMAVPASDAVDGPPRATNDILAVAAPHVSPEGGVAGYGAAYRALGPHLRDRTFVILGTSHYGRPNRFGLTRKPFRTPLGDTVTDASLVDDLQGAAADCFDVEDYCHAVEHSIEFQVLFLQSLYGPAVRILPILCGPFVSSGSATPSRPEDDPTVAAGLAALARLGRDHRDRIAWVLGVDLAHVGRRYGDAVDAHAHVGSMIDVEARDRERLERIVAGDADGFWDLVRATGDDDLKWCGSAPLYAFLRACPAARGQVDHYDQWNIDANSVVSFAALSFRIPA